MRSSIPISCSEPDMRMLSSRLLNIRSQSKPITSARPFLKFWMTISPILVWNVQTNIYKNVYLDNVHQQEDLLNKSHDSGLNVWTWKHYTGPWSAYSACSQPQGGCTRSWGAGSLTRRRSSKFASTKYSTCSQTSLGWNHPQASAARSWSDQTPPPQQWSQCPHNPVVINSINLDFSQCIAHRHLNIPFIGFQSQQISVEFWVQRVKMINVQGLACNKSIIIRVRQWQNCS